MNLSTLIIAISVLGVVSQAIEADRQVRLAQVGCANPFIPGYGGQVFYASGRRAF